MYNKFPSIVIVVVLLNAAYFTIKEWEIRHLPTYFRLNIAIIVTQFSSRHAC